MANVHSIPVSVAATITQDVASLSAATTTKVQFTVPGARVGHHVLVKAESLETNLGIAGAYVSAADTVQVLIVNPTAGAINPASQDFDFLIL